MPFNPVFLAIGMLLSAANALAGVEDADYQVSEIAYDLRDISASGTELILGDDEVVGPVPIGFVFNYYGEAYSQVYVSSNGFVTFNPTSNSGCCSGVPIPTPGGVDNFIAAFWEDLSPPNGGTIRYQTIGTPPNREFVVGFYQVEHFRSDDSVEGNTPVEMEIIIHELSNEVELQYTTATTSGESDHSVGVESAGGMFGTQVDFGTGFSYSMEGRLLSPGGADGETGPARFAVDKEFNDDNPAEVTVTIACNTGLPLQQSAAIAQDDGVVFVVTDFEDGALDCTIVENPVPEGYADFYSADGGITFSSTEACEYTEVGSGAVNACVVRNQLGLVLVEVTKRWIDENPQFSAAEYAKAAFECFNEQFGIPAFGTLEFVGDGAVDGFFVFPHWDGTTTCDITETLVENGVEQDDSACRDLAVAPGVPAACTLYNTRLYEGIPTLSQYGLGLLALLMLGMGFVAFRRVDPYNFR